MHMLLIEKGAELSEESGIVVKEVVSDLAIIASDPSAIEAASDPGQFVIQACERAKSWLAEALEHGDIEQIVELKSRAEAIRVYTMSKQLGQDAALSAAEIVRRAERGIGLAIRKGQEVGEIATARDAKVYAGRLRQQKDKNLPLERPRMPTDVIPQDELTGNGAGIYHLTDDVPDERFETAIAEAKAEGNLSRANVVRKVRDTAANPAPTTKPPAKPGRKRRPITDTARDVGWALRKEAEKVERLLADDRLVANKAQVAAHLRGHLTYAVEALQKALGQLTLEGE